MKNRYKIFSTGTKVTHARKFLDFKFFPIGEILSQTDKGNKDEKKKNVKKKKQFNKSSVFKY